MKVPQARSSQVWLIRNRDVLPPSISTSPSNDEQWAVLDSENPMRLSVSPGEQERQKHADVGALRDGEPLELYSWEAMGLLSQYAGVGIMMGFFDVLVWPIFQNYLHMEGYQIASYSALINIGWSSKIFFSVLADCFPIRGYHRRPYMVLGWIICAVSCLIVATTKFPAPYYSSHELFDMPRGQYTRADIARLNLDAPNTGGFFILMCLAACLGYVMATVAADGMVVQYAQREPASIRGRTQTAMYITRDAYSILPMLLVGFCMSDYKYGGDFTWSVEPNGIFWFVVTLVSLLPLRQSSCWLKRQMRQPSACGAT
ncbi:hypothetical protein AeMF1_019936 [Aphanomyces euteiches]|nr:hypothetical protein AeMF1_019936 [Aphanomyces euteiches]KAH9183296.1 hypothetical protein AeNC1_014726 [Aphanomyces euteiches]